MSVAKTLGELKERGVELWFEGARLRFRAPKGTLSAEDRARLSGQRDAVTSVTTTASRGVIVAIASATVA